VWSCAVKSEIEESEAIKAHKKPYRLEVIGCRL
jgi:hypothetical protein